FRAVSVAVQIKKKLAPKMTVLIYACLLLIQVS
ncbi:MAG: hypothetical protein EZS28_026372, partial [Streblomastix strix]